LAVFLLLSELLFYQDTKNSAHASVTTITMASIESLPIVDLEQYLANPESPEGIATSKAIVDCLIKTSCLIVRDPRTTFQDNDVFIDTMEKYYNLPDEVKKKDARPQVRFFQNFLTSGSFLTAAICCIFASTFHRFSFTTKLVQHQKVLKFQEITKRPLTILTTSTRQ